MRLRSCDTAIVLGAGRGAGNIINAQERDQDGGALAERKGPRHLSNCVGAYASRQASGTSAPGAARLLS